MSRVLVTTARLVEGRRGHVPDVHPGSTWPNDHGTSDDRRPGPQAREGSGDVEVLAVSVFEQG